MEQLRIPASDGLAQLNVQLDGPDGAPVLTCLHTLATDSSLFDAQVAALAERYRVVRIDMRGHGKSTSGVSGAAQDAAYAMADLAEDVVAVWDALKIKSSLILGLSIGGMIALEVALRHPKRVDALIAAACRSDAPEPFVAMWHARRETLAQGGLSAVADVTLPTWLTPAASDAARAHARAMIEATSVAGYIGATRALEGLNVFPRLSQLTPPVLFLVGDSDGPHPVAQRGMHAATPGSQFLEIPGAAHLINLERPQAFLEGVFAFFDSAKEKTSV